MDNNCKKILVTGAKGFLGCHLVEHFTRVGHETTGLARPSAAPYATQILTAETEHWPEAIAEFRPDVIFHCAGSSSVPKSLEEPLTDFLSGPALTARLLEAVRHSAPAAAFVFVSSAAVYGQPDRLPIAETTVPRPISPYGYHKLQSELSCEAYAKVYGLRTASARIFSAYGPGLRRQVVWDLIQKLKDAKRLTLRGTGEESRDFIQVNDVVRALDRISCAAAFGGERYNVACGVEVKIADLARLVAQIFGAPDAEIAFDGEHAPGSPLRWRADIRRLSALGFAPSVTLEDGLSRLASQLAADCAAIPA